MDSKTDFLQSLYEKLSLHGIRFLQDNNNLQKPKKKFWISMLIIATTSMCYVSVLISRRYQSNNYLSTVFEDTSYSVSHIPFPAITICSGYSFNMSKLDRAVNAFYPGKSANDTILFRKFIKSLQNFEFENLEDLEFKDLNKIDNLDLSEIVSFMSNDCDGYLLWCWWANRYLNCCDIFSLQVSKFGMCYSFNSLTSTESALVDKFSENFPWRTHLYGDYGGLRVWVDLSPSQAHPRKGKNPGLYIMVHDPSDWPSTSTMRFLPKGMEAAITLEPILFTSSTDVKKVHYKTRKCLYHKEAKEYGYRIIQGLNYSRQNCMIKMEKEILYKTCNCVVNWMFPKGNRASNCNATGLKCIGELRRKNILQEKLSNLSHECLIECDGIDYMYYIDPSYDAYDFSISQEKSIKDLVQVDVHYKVGFLPKYRADVRFGILDLIAAYGGIAGLFLGFSFLTVIEFLFMVISTVVTRLQREYYKSKIMYLE